MKKEIIFSMPNVRRAAVEKAIQKLGLTVNDSVKIGKCFTYHFNIIVDSQYYHGIANLFFEAGCIYTQQGKSIPGSEPVGARETDFHRRLRKVAGEQGYELTGDYSSFGELVSPSVTLRVKGKLPGDDPVVHEIKFSGSTQDEAVENFILELKKLGE